MEQKLEVPRNYVQFLKLIKVALLDGLPYANGYKSYPLAMYTCHAAQEVCQWALDGFARDEKLQRDMSSLWILTLYANVHAAIQLAINPNVSLYGAPDGGPRATLDVPDECCPREYRAAWVQAAIDGKHTYDGKPTIYAGLRFLREVGVGDWSHDLRGEE